MYSQIPHEQINVHVSQIPHDQINLHVSQICSQISNPMIKLMYMQVKYAQSNTP